MTNPANKLPPEYDDMHPSDYDPAFTADISTRMRIPNRIAMAEGNPDGNYVHHEDMQRNARMSIPDKIVIMGQENSGGMQPLPDLHLDLLRQSHTSNYVGLQTPPRVITLDERPFPAAGDKHEPLQEEDEDELAVEFEKGDSEKNLRNGFVPITPPRQGITDLHRELMMTTPSGPLLIDDDDDDDFMRLRKQVLKLSLHVKRLEEENSRRSQRELFLYPVVVSYVLFQLAKWFLASRH